MDRTGRGTVPGPEPGLLRASAQISVITLLARVAGFARWIVLGLTVGATYLGNTYQTANWVPNIVFELVAGGVLSAVFVPTFVAELERGRERGMEVAASLANVFLLISVPIVVAGALLARPIMRAMTIGVADEAVRAAQIELGAWFLWFFLPQIPLYLLAMVMTGLLHAHRRFAIPAAAPLFSSLVVISTYLTFRFLGPGADLGTVTPTQLYVLAGGTTAGVFVLAFSQLPSVLRLGVRWRPVLGWRDPVVRRAIRAGVWGIAFFAVTEVGLLVTLVLANRVEGGVVGYQVAFAFFELPNALVGLPVAVALFPALAQRAARGDEAGYAGLLSTGFRATAFLAAPAAVGLFVLAPTLADAILGRGGPAEAAPALVASALRALAVGLPAYALVATLTRSFYARHQTRPPVALNGVSVGTYALIAVPATLVLAPTGGDALRILGLGHAAGQWVGVALGVVLLAGRAPGWTVATDLRSFAASLLRATVMGGLVWFVVDGMSDAQAPLAVLAGLAAGGFAYLALSARSPELRRALDLVKGLRR